MLTVELAVLEPGMKYALMVVGQPGYSGQLLSTDFGKAISIFREPDIYHHITANSDNLFLFRQFNRFDCAHHGQRSQVQVNDSYGTFSPIYYSEMVFLHFSVLCLYTGFRGSAKLLSNAA